MDVLVQWEPTGTIEKDKRGGRLETLKEQDKVKRDAILEHINRFPRMESHYCRQKSTRDYLHPDLNKKKMHAMFVEEYASKNIVVSYSTYCEVLKTQNLSFHNPKKDLCKLCESYRKGDAEKKIELQSQFEEHTKEKEAVRKKKENAKHDDSPNKTVATFDLQQVIYLPKTNDNMLFYKRRLGNFNLTVYELKTKTCHCFTWHEGQGKRGPSEIGTCLTLYLDTLDEACMKEVTLFADGCPGQNKNSVIAAMLLNFLSRSVNTEKLNLLFFEKYHGQNEGDSAHSAISNAIDSAGDLYVPAQLMPIFRLARKKRPYIVHSLQSEDFLDFKMMAKLLRILSVRVDDQGNSVNWTEMREVMVTKKDLTKIYYKKSHLVDDFNSISLKVRLQQDGGLHPDKLYSGPPIIAKEKYDDLVSLCSGDLPVIRISEYGNFFKCLPH